MASLVKPLGRRYALRSLPKPKPHAQSGGRAALARNHPAAAVCLADLEGDDLNALDRLTRGESRVRVIGVSGERRANGARAARLFACLPRRASRRLVEQTIAAAFANIELADREHAARIELRRTQREMELLNRIGMALSSTRDVNALLELILAMAREITGADAGSLYLVEIQPDGGRQLRFKQTQNDSTEFPFSEITMPMTETSMAGYVALHGEVVNVPDAYQIPPGRPYHFNPKFDQESGYRTCSMLTLPMKNGKGEVLGVLQLINCRRKGVAPLISTEAVQREVQPFSQRAVRLAHSLASQAAVAYENSRLYQDIETLFEGFVQASVKAIEQRDPTTSGHSHRVSTMTVGLAETVDRADVGSYAAVHFTREQMKEIRYAALLHDFGKVGVREEVLVKAKKLYPAQLALVDHRFDDIRKELEARTQEEKIRVLLEKNREEAVTELALLDEEHMRRLAGIDHYFQFIMQANEPTVLPAGNFEHLLEIGQQIYFDPRGVEHPYLNLEEVRFLSIPRGSLDRDERFEIESHVVHSFNFLMQIPWTSEIRDIPWIARAHHEKLNGSGYPYRLKSEEIPLPAKMMTICDIFDALSASDRPYKKAVPPGRALEILETSVRDNELDADLFQLFLDAKIYQITMRHSRA